MYDYDAIITNVVDGDTYDVDIDLGFHIHIHERIRILGLNTPECRGKEKELGLICKEWAKEQFLNKKVLLFSKQEIKSPQTDSFGRWLCYVYVEDLKNDITRMFTTLGCNKLSEDYSEDAVRTLKNSVMEK